MATKLNTVNETVTATEQHGLLLYLGTNRGNIYTMVKSTGAITLRYSFNEAIDSLSIAHPTLYVTGNKGGVYSIALSTTVDPYAITPVGANANATGSGIVLTRSTNTAGNRVYTDDGGAVLYGTGSVPDIRGDLSRTLITINQTGGNIRVHALMGQLKSYDGYWNGEVVSATHGRLEIARVAATLVLGGYGVSSGVLSVVDTSGVMTVNTNHVLAGVAVISDFKATLTQTGICPAFYAANYDTTNWSDSTARAQTWTHGVYVKNAGYAFGFGSGSGYASGAKVASCTVAVTSSGTVLTFDAILKVDIAGTAYYFGGFTAGNINGE